MAYIFSLLCSFFTAFILFKDIFSMLLWFYEYLAFFEILKKWLLWHLYYIYNLLQSILVNTDLISINYGNFALIKLHFLPVSVYCYCHID